MPVHLLLRLLLTMLNGCRRVVLIGKGVMGDLLHRVALLRMAVVVNGHVGRDRRRHWRDGVLNGD